VTDDMGAGHERAFGEQAEIDELRRSIDMFLRTRRHRVSGKTLMVLADAAAELEQDSDRITRAWG
jgi:hypothetical protein